MYQRSAHSGEVESNSATLHTHGNEGVDHYI